MKRLTLAIAIGMLMNSGAARAEWTPTNENDQLVAHVDFATIRRMGDIVKMWMLNNYKAAKTAPDGKRYLSSKWQSEFDCKEKNFRTLAFSWHSGKTGSGKVVLSKLDVDGKWIPVPPDSTGDMMWKIACGKLVMPADVFEDAKAAAERRDYSRALGILQPFASSGDARAQTSIGAMYEIGQGVAQDQTEAIKWYRLAAAQGEPWAQLNLGIRYQSGQGVTLDYAEAAKWYRLAAVQRNPVAQAMLGEMYAEGQGVARDYVRAYMWFNLGATSGVASAVKNRDITAKRMASQQIAQAQKMTRECQQRNFERCE